MKVSCQPRPQSPDATRSDVLCGRLIQLLLINKGEAEKRPVHFLLERPKHLLRGKKGFAIERPQSVVRRLFDYR